MSVSLSNSPSASPSPGQPVNDYTRDALDALPSTKDDLATVYTTPEEGDVYLDDNRFVDLIGSGSKYLIHQFKKDNNNRHDRIKVKIKLKSTLAPTSSTIYLQMWNGITNAWETMDSEALKGANEEFSLVADVNETSYFDFRESFAEVAVRVYQLNNSGVQKTLSVELVQISFLITYKAKYNLTGNRYKDKYSSKQSVYSPKYPHKNPQDDF